MPAPEVKGESRDSCKTAAMARIETIRLQGVECGCGRGGERAARIVLSMKMVLSMAQAID
jgi:hypothetical protein